MSGGRNEAHTIPRLGLTDDTADAVIDATVPTTPRLPLGGAAYQGGSFSLPAHRRGAARETGRGRPMMPGLL